MMKKYELLVERTNFAPVKGNLFLLHMVFCCISHFHASGGRTVQGIIGRNVSLSWTFNSKNDAIDILHDSTPLLWGWPALRHFGLYKPDERLRITEEQSTGNTITVTINIINVTKNYAGNYHVQRNINSQDLNDRVSLTIFDETFIPRITVVPHYFSDSSMMLQCNSSSAFKDNTIWKLNGTLIKNYSKYHQNNTFLSIMNVTANDRYNLYTCEDVGNGFGSGPSRLNMSGPSAITFEPKITTAQEHSSLNVSCLTDCYPICSWKWTYLDLSLRQDKFISTENTLHIQNITRHQAGTYSCRVLNKITGIEMNNFTLIQVLYGPDVISFSSSEKNIQINEKDSISITCFADCFPPCHIHWAETNAHDIVRGAELKLVNVNRNANYTCHVTNVQKDNDTISDTINVIVKSGINHYTTKAKTLEEDTEEFPSKRHLLYILLGSGFILVLSLLASLLYKSRTCLCSNGVSDTNTSDGGLKQMDEILHGNYWTIVSNAEGELSSAIETNFEQGREQIPVGQNMACARNQSEQLVGPDDVEVNEVLDGYINPVQLHPVQHDDYIQPVHTDDIETDFERCKEQLLIRQYMVSIHNEPEQLMGPNDVKVNEDFDGYLNPVQSRNIQIDDYIHPVHIDAIEIDLDRDREEMLNGQNAVSIHNESETNVAK